MHLIYFEHLVKPIDDRKAEKEGNYLNIIKNICQNPGANIILNRKNLKAFPLESRTE